jgi:ribosome-associated translation inhibitor RaiA
MTRKGNAPVRRSAFPPASLVSNQGRVGPTRTTETPLRVKTFGLAADGASRAYIRTRAGFKLGKFALHIQSVEIRLKDESGPHGEPLITCALSVLLGAGGVVIVERAGQEARATFDVAIDVAERAVRRWIQRRRSPKRSSLLAGLQDLP